MLLPARSTILWDKFFRFNPCSPENFCNKFTLILLLFRSFISVHDFQWVYLNNTKK